MCQSLYNRQRDSSLLREFKVITEHGHVWVVAMTREEVLERYDILFRNEFFKYIEE